MKRKRTVAISTWSLQDGLNYGCSLQSAGMQKLVKDCGYKPITIYHIFIPNSKDRKLFGNRGKYLISRGRAYLWTKHRFLRYASKYIKLSKVCYTDHDVIEYVKKRCDILLCGSDSIWKACFICSLFLWDYKELDGYPRLAYAPSLQSSKELAYGNIDQAIKRFDALSGREPVVEQFLKEYTDKKVETVLDPTLAVSESFWENQVRNYRLIKEDYVLCYVLSEAEMHRIAIDEIKKQYNVDKVVYINTNYIDKRQGFTDYRGEAYSKIVGPREFLSLIKYSKAVCTDSFHGVALSIVFRKEFYMFGRDRLWEQGADYRALNLFERLQIGNRMVYKNEDIKKLQTIEWDVVEKRLFEERKKSVKYLQEALDLCNTKCK